MIWKPRKTRTMPIYHLAWRSQWEDGLRGNEYHAASLASEGFIHATREPGQVIDVANRFFASEPSEELLVIAVDESKLAVPVREEDPGVGHLFPHIYGPIDLAAVVSVRPVQRSGDHWVFPKA